MKAKHFSITTWANLGKLLIKQKNPKMKDFLGNSCWRLECRCCNACKHVITTCSLENFLAEREGKITAGQKTVKPMHTLLLPSF